MPSFRPIIRDAYTEILRREADAGGLEHYNRLMNQGSSEADLREALLRSDEYAQKNPLFPLAPRVGLNVHIPSNAILNDVARNLGVGWIRVDFDWYRIEPSRGVFQWQDTDRVVDRATELGLEILATLSYTPAWASSNPSNPRIGDPPASVAYWTDIVRATVERYRDRVVFWQPWNEPNIHEFWNGSMQRYRSEILQPGASLMRQLVPGGSVVAPGLANVGNWRDWFDEAMQSKSLIDIINHHNYPQNGRDAIVELRSDQLFRPSLRTKMRDHGVDDRPFWLTETGRKTSDSNQRQQPWYDDCLRTLQQELWVNKLFFFHYWDGPGQGNGGFGIVNENFSPKPVYRTLQAALNTEAFVASVMAT
nr:Putative glycosyl hydrolases family 39 [uncultured bacterium]